MDSTDATAVLYVRLSDINNVFMYQSDANDITNVTADDIKYYVFHRKWPTELKVNPSHAMLDKPESAGMLGHQALRTLMRAFDVYGTVRETNLEYSNVIGVPKNKLIFSEDITSRKNAEEELRIASVAFQSSDGMIVTDHQGTILRVNSAFEKISGYPAEELVGKNTSIFKSVEYHDEAFYRNLWEAVSTEGKWEGSVWNRNKEGRTIPVWLSISAVKAAI